MVKKIDLFSLQLYFYGHKTVNDTVINFIKWTWAEVDQKFVLWSFGDTTDKLTVLYTIILALFPWTRLDVLDDHFDWQIIWLRKTERLLDSLIIDTPLLVSCYNNTMSSICDRNSNLITIFVYIFFFRNSLKSLHVYYIFIYF